MMVGIILLFILVFNQHSHAQVRATGHVFAEIVEPTALSARTTNNHVVHQSKKGNENDLVLAEVKLSGGSSLNVDVAVQSNSLHAENGEMFSFNAFVCPECPENNMNGTKSEKAFTLKGTPGKEIPLKKNKVFRGEYRVIFMYN